ncbi:MAG: efflux RND transporter periplasmic adaptor subunit [Methylomonas lenta]|nr:efflux RND transporter periplasmic adaptor subunit [Methylomonas lenta]
MHTNIRPKEILRQRNRRLKRLTIAILMAGLISVGYWWELNRGSVSTDDAFVMGNLIPLKAQTDGIVVEILTENTLHVKKGDVLVKLDGMHAQLTLQQTEAELGEIVRNLVSLTAKVETLKQRIIAKEAALNQVRHDLDRFKAAAYDGAVSDQKVQNTQDKIRELEAVIRENQAEKISIEAQISGTTIENHPAIEKAKSQVRAAFLNFQRRNIVAPVSGYVAKRKVQLGDNVKPGSPLLAIVPLDDLWVDANFLETQVAGIRPGQTADIRVDAYGNELTYHGIVQGILPGTGSTFALLPTDNATGNFIHVAERVQVRIGLDPKELQDNPLQPGLSTVTRINTHEAGRPLLSSRVGIDGDAYRTEIYQDELAGVEQRIQQIIVLNKG